MGGEGAWNITQKTDLQKVILYLTMFSTLLSPIVFSNWILITPCLKSMASSPFNSADTIPCKLGSSWNQKTQSSFDTGKLPDASLLLCPVEGIPRQAHSTSCASAKENDFNTGSWNDVTCDETIPTYFRHRSPHKSVWARGKNSFSRVLVM